MKNKLKLLLAALLFAAFSASAQVVLFADSLGVSGAATTEAKKWTSIFTASTGLSVQNKSRPGGMVGDSAALVYGTTLAAGERAILAFGVNDQRTHPIGAASIGYYVDGLRNHAVWLSSTSKQTARSVGGESGSWGDTGILGIGRYTTVNGSKKSFTLSGSTVYVSMLRVEAGAYGATYSIKIDGVSMGSFDNNAAGVTSPHTGAYPYTERLHRFAGLSTGSHTVEIEKTSGAYLYVQWAASNVQSAPRPVFIADIPYPNSYQWGGSAANVDAYNAARTTMIAELVADGYPIYGVGINSAINPALHCAWDDLHLNDAGESAYGLKMAASFGVVPSPVTFTSIALEKGSDGLFYANDGGTRIRILTD